MRLVLLSVLVLGCKDDPTPIVTPDCTVGFADRDGDGFGSNLETTDCQEPIVSNQEDCDDSLTAVNPDAIEICDTIDNNCDGLIDLDDPTIDGAAQYLDADGDGFGAGDAVLLCEAIADYVTNNSDCNDTVSEINPDAAEICDGIDNDCDDLLDDLDDNWDPTGAPVFYEDLDDDNYGSDVEVLACERPPGTTTNGADCDDTDATTFPGAPELCNNQDSDCDGAPDGSTVQLDACADLEQSYSGPYTVTLVSGMSTSTCTGTADLTIDRAQSPVVQGSFTCTLDQATGSFPLDQTGTIEGWVTRDGVAGGSVQAIGGTLRDWEGTVSDAAFSGTTDGLQLDGALSWDLDMSFSATPVF